MSEIINIPQVIPVSFRLSKLAFKLRFPREKWKAARQASKVDAGLADFFEDYDLATYIDTKDERTARGVIALGLPQIPVEFRLTPEEISAVLEVPCQPGEEP